MKKDMADRIKKLEKQQKAQYKKQEAKNQLFKSRFKSRFQEYDNCLNDLKLEVLELKSWMAKPVCYSHS